MAEEEGEFEQLSDEEKLKIAQHFLLSSPPGQFSEVLTDVRKILPEGILTDAMATGIARVYNNRNGKVFMAADGKVVVNANTEIDATHYFNASSGTSLCIDHLTGQVAGDGQPVPVHFSGETNGLGLYREALQTALRAYSIGQYRPSDMAAVSVACNESNQIVVNITGERTNIKNFWAGRWSSSWIVDAANPSISGEIKIHAHIFEDGNVQLQQNKAFPRASLRGESEESLASAVVAFIQAAETALQEGLEEMYRNMNEETLKSIRRIMPFTRTKMEWNINAVRMVRQTQAAKK
jgi:capping protein alpha